MIRRLARKEGLTVSEYLRLRAGGTAGAAPKPRRIRCRRTEAMIFSSVENRPPLTTQTVLQMLSEFP
jgi:hypothetical protein